MCDESVFEPGSPRQPQEESAFLFIDNMDLNSTTQSLLDRIRSIQKPIYDEASAKEILELAINKINNLDVNNLTILDQHTKLLLTSDREERAKTTKNLSFLYLALATIAQEKNAEVIAWRAVSKSEYYLGLTEALLDPHIAASKRKAKKGGEQKAKNANILMERIYAHLSEKKMLTRGSETPSATANAVAAALMKEKEEGKISFPIIEDDLRSKILNLLVETTLKK